jgi:hypothetical protein
VNDEELRAFLDSSKPGESQKAKRPAPSDAQQSDAPTAAQRSDGLRVPSFDELMGFTAPQNNEPEIDEDESAMTQAEPEAPASRPALITDPVPETRPAGARRASSEPEVESAPLTLESLFDSADDDAAPEAAVDDGELVPLVLPGFSPEPRRTEPLPPVFRSEPAEPPPAPAPESPIAERSPYAAPITPPAVMRDPAPTQPYSIAEPTPTEPMAAPTPKPAAAKAAQVAAAPKPAQPAPETETDVFAAIGLAHETPESQPTAVSGGGGADDYEPIAVTGGGGGGRKALPWIIVGGGLIIALVASVLVINGVRGNGDDPAPSPAPTTTEAPPTTTEAPEPTETPEPEPTPDEAPVVDVGSTWTLPIDQWSINVEMSSKYGGSTPYELRDGNTRAMFTLPLAASLPDSCAHAREPWVWGLLKNDDGTLEAIRPEPRCTDADAAAVYDTLWGLLDASAKSATPM